MFAKLSEPQKRAGIMKTAFTLHVMLTIASSFSVVEVAKANSIQARIKTLQKEEPQLDDAKSSSQAAKKNLFAAKYNSTALSSKERFLQFGAKLTANASVQKQALPEKNYKNNGKQESKTQKHKAKTIKQAQASNNANSNLKVSESQRKARADSDTNFDDFSSNEFSVPGMDEFDKTDAADNSGGQQKSHDKKHNDFDVDSQIDSFFSHADKEIEQHSNQKQAGNEAQEEDHGMQNEDVQNTDESSKKQHASDDIATQSDQKELSDEVQGRKEERNEAEEQEAEQSDEQQAKPAKKSAKLKKMLEKARELRAKKKEKQKRIKQEKSKVNEEETKEKKQEEKQQEKEEKEDEEKGEEELPHEKIKEEKPVAKVVKVEEKKEQPVPLTSPPPSQEVKQVAPIVQQQQVVQKEPLINVNAAFKFKHPKVELHQHKHFENHAHINIPRKQHIEPEPEVHHDAHHNHQNFKHEDEIIEHAIGSLEHHEEPEQHIEHHEEHHFEPVAHHNIEHVHHQEMEQPMDIANPHLHKNKIKEHWALINNHNKHHQFTAQEHHELPQDHLSHLQASPEGNHHENKDHKSMFGSPTPIEIDDFSELNKHNNHHHTIHGTQARTFSEPKTYNMNVIHHPNGLGLSPIAHSNTLGAFSTIKSVNVAASN